jgi:hypothetical protein
MSRSRFIILMVGIEVAFLILISFVSISYIYDYNKKNLATNAENILDLFSLAVSNSILTNDLSAISAITNNIFNSTAFFYSLEVRDNSETLLMYRSEFFDDYTNIALHTLSTPVLINKTKIGVITAKVSDYTLNADLGGLTIKLICISFVSLFASSVSLWWFTHVVLIKLRAINSGLEALISDKQPISIPCDNRTEVGIVICKFNELAAELKKQARGTVGKNV